MELEIRVSDTLWAEGVSSIHQKEQLPLLRHGFVFLRGRLTPIGYRAMPIPKVRREGSAVSQVRPGPEKSIPIWKARRCTICIS